MKESTSTIDWAVAKSDLFDIMVRLENGDLLPDRKHHIARFGITPHLELYKFYDAPESLAAMLRELVAEGRVWMNDDNNPMIISFRTKAPDPAISLQMSAWHTNTTP